MKIITLTFVSVSTCMSSIPVPSFVIATFYVIHRRVILIALVLLLKITTVIVLIIIATTACATNVMIDGIFITKDHHHQCHHNHCHHHHYQDSVYYYCYCSGVLMVLNLLMPFSLLSHHPEDYCFGLLINMINRLSHE